jgi:hypothetical protein
MEGMIYRPALKTYTSLPPSPPNIPLYPISPPCSPIFIIVFWLFYPVHSTNGSSRLSPPRLD